jgi:hypothetical protein
MRKNEDRVIHLTLFWWTFKRLSDKSFALEIIGATKFGKGRRYKVSIKIPYSYIGYMMRDLRKGMIKQIDRLKGYLKEGEIEQL